MINVKESVWAREGGGSRSLSTEKAADLAFSVTEATKKIASWWMNQTGEIYLLVGFHIKNKRWLYMNLLDHSIPEFTYIRNISNISV